MGAGDALVVPREFLEGAPTAVDGAMPANADVLHLVGVDKLDGGHFRPQRYIVCRHGTVVLQVGGTVEGGTLLQIELDAASEFYRTYLILTCGYHHASSSSL